MLTRDKGSAGRTELRKYVTAGRTDADTRRDGVTPAQTADRRRTDSVCGMSVYFRQLLSGRDFAVGDPVATQMVNFAYLIGDTDRREAVIVDPAYSPGELVDTLAADDMRLTGVLVTHHHPDHVGGDLMGHQLTGLAELLGKHPVPVHVNRQEAEWVRRSTGVSATDLTEHDHDDEVLVGDVPIRLLHTPGHTPGSQCFLLDGKLVAGDTLFLQGCGRTDFPGGDPDALYQSLRQLAELTGDPVVHPGHQYSAEPKAALSEVRRTNVVYRAESLEQFRSLFG
jgi:glyoxylase-like metal-dependent hydrolase (beta-lactamase superfamily II)